MPAPRSSASGGSSKSKSSKKATEGDSPNADARVFLLTGAEAGRKSAEAQRMLRDATDETFADFDAETLDGHTATADRILSAVSTVPLGEKKKAVLVRDTQQMDAEEQKRLANGLPKIPASGLLILHTGTPIVEEGKTRRQSVVVPDLSKAVKKDGQILEFSLPKAENLREWILRAAQEQGKKLSSDAVALFAQLPEGDVSRIEAEMAKVAAYVGNAPTITGADVEAVLSRGPDDVIFKLCDAVGMRRSQEALGYVSQLFQSGGRPDSIAPRALVMLARQIRLITQFRYLGEKKLAGRGAGPVPPEILEMLPSDGAGGILSNPRTGWMADKYITQGRNFTAMELAKRMERLLAADLSLKGIEPGGDSPQAVLQRLVVELC
ncbi:MAG: DNA polymerase III subunit delta [Armatimonadaceae bacterium]